MLRKFREQKYSYPSTGTDTLGFVQKSQRNLPVPFLNLVCQNCSCGTETTHVWLVVNNYFFFFFFLQTTSNQKEKAIKMESDTGKTKLQLFKQRCGGKTKKERKKNSWIAIVVKRKLNYGQYIYIYIDWRKRNCLIERSTSGQSLMTVKWEKWSWQEAVLQRWREATRWAIPWDFQEPILALCSCNHSRLWPPSPSCSTLLFRSSFLRGTQHKRNQVLTTPNNQKRSSYRIVRWSYCSMGVDVRLHQLMTKIVYLYMPKTYILWWSTANML